MGAGGREAWMFQSNTEFEKKPNPVGYFVFFPIHGMPRGKEAVGVSKSIGAPSAERQERRGKIHEVSDAGAQNEGNTHPGPIPCHRPLHLLLAVMRKLKDKGTKELVGGERQDEMEVGCEVAADKGEVNRRHVQVRCSWQTNSAGSSSDHEREGGTTSLHGVALYSANQN